MRQAARVDANQAEAVRCLRDMGATVQPLHQLGRGCPDLLVGFRGVNCLVEMKDGSKLTADQVEWHGQWGGIVVVANSAEQACKLVIAQAKDAGKL